MGSHSTSEPFAGGGEGARSRRSRARRFALLAPAVLSLLPLLAPALACRRPSAPDFAGAKVPKRIVALTPSLTETLFALGLGDRVVGVGDYVNWPPAAVRKPHAGGLFNPNVERIAALHPDLAVLMPSERDLAAKLAPLGIESLVVPIETLADIERSFTAIAGRCGVPERGERLREAWRAGLRGSPPPGRPVKVLLSVGRDAGRISDVTVAGPQTFLDEILTSLGAVNAFADAPVRYPQINLEEIVARRPDLIVELRSDPLSPEAEAALIREWSQLPGLTAAGSGRVVVIAAGYTLVPGPRLPLLARDLRRALVRAESGAREEMRKEEE